MAVTKDVTRAYIEHELKMVADLADSCCWRILLPETGLTFDVVMYAHNGDAYILTFECSDYREQPPLVEFIDPDTGVEATVHAYPKSKDSLFHASGPCICAPFNRKAYKSIHKEWTFGDWTKSTANNYNWSNISTLGDILGLIQTRLRAEHYMGRMA